MCLLVFASRFNQMVGVGTVTGRRDVIYKYNDVA